MILYEVSAKANGKTYAARFEIAPRMTHESAMAVVTAAMQSLVRRFMFGESKPTEGEELHDFQIHQISTT